MSVDSRKLAEWLISCTIILFALVIGRPLLVPFAFALLLWAVLNALANTLQRLRLPAWLAWLSSLILIVGALYVVARIFGQQTAAMAGQAPEYYAKLQHLMSEWMHFLRLGQPPQLRDLFSASGVADFVGQAAASAGGLLFSFGLVAVYVGFLLAEQRYLEAKLEKLQSNEERRDETSRV